MEPYRIRPITPQDDARVAWIIRTVMPEFGADGPGFAIHDPEVEHMSVAYGVPGAAYFVIEVGDEVLGGGGIAPLAGGPDGVCELRKMYFLPELRGKGMGFTRCYLETLTGMDAAQRLYDKAGFSKLCGPLGATGHHGCDRWYAKELT